MRCTSEQVSLNSKRILCTFSCFLQRQHQSEPSCLV